MNVRQQLIEIVTIDILENLPVSSLVRFRSVSKWWCKLIKSPYFINRHFVKRRVNDTMLLVRRMVRTPPTCRSPGDLLSFHDMQSEELKEVRPNLSISIIHRMEPLEYCNSEVYLFGPIDGILCMVAARRTVFCNPALREFWETPPCDYAFPEGAYDFIVGQGFGNTDSNDFKVVCIRNVESTGHPGSTYDAHGKVVHVYSTRTNSWKIVFEDVIGFPYMDHHPCSDIFFNGACHWNANSLKSGIGRDIILSLNLNTELFEQYEYPEYFKGLFQSEPRLMVLKGCLSILWFKEWMVSPLEIWVMKEYGIRESWTKLLEIGPYQPTRVFCYWKNDEWLLAEDMDGHLVSFAVHTNAVKTYEICGYEDSFYALIYKESLISIKSIIGTSYKP